MKKTAIAAVVIFVAALLIGSRAKSEPTAWEEYIVSSGDTVSDIAFEITPEGEDYRENQKYIIKKNKIKNGRIYPGQVILVPVEGE